MSDAVSRLELYNLYNPHDPSDPKIAIHPEENLEISIFNRDVTWKNPEDINQKKHEVNLVNATNNNPPFRA